MKKKVTKSLRNLVLVLGDQLNMDSAAFDGFDPSLDAVWMAEVGDEATHVWSHKARIAVCVATNSGAAGLVRVIRVVRGILPAAFFEHILRIIDQLIYIRVRIRVVSDGRGLDIEFVLGFTAQVALLNRLLYAFARRRDVLQRSACH